MYITLKFERFTRVTPSGPHFEMWRSKQSKYYTGDRIERGRHVREAEERAKAVVEKNEGTLEEAIT